MKKKTNRGFTLIELIIVLLILTIIISAGVIYYNSIVAHAQTETCAVTRRNVEQIDQIYQRIYEASPTDYATMLQRLKDSNLLEEDPVCPCGGSYSWQVLDGTRVLVCSEHGS